MAAKHAILEINGQRYEAHSGDWYAQNQAHKSARSIDGMVSDTGVHAGLAPVARQPISNIVTKPTMNDIVRPGVNPALRRQQPSQILMRQAVKKPDHQPMKRLKVQSSVKSLPVKKSAHTLQKKLSVANLDHVRAERALTVQKSGNVARFAKHAPSHQVHHADIPAIAHAPHPAISMPRQKAAHTKHRTANDIFEEALAHATGHEQVYHHKKRRGVPKQAVILVSSFVFVFVVSGIVVSQNMGNVKMYMAASKAGFSAGLPNYQPSGYRLDKVNSSAGVVAANFLSNSDDRNYTLTQKPSKWDSQALRELFVTQNSKDFYTVEKNGLTIFIYGEHQATWVNGGVWYQLSGDDALSDRQLVELASSF